jgi:cytochrome c-type biogenesis protein CcmE
MDDRIPSRGTRRRRHAVAAVAGLLAVTAVAARAGEPGLADLVENAQRYHGTRVIVSGTVTAVTTRVSRTGDRYYAFDLSDGERRVTVFGSGRPPCALGATARVAGTVEITGARGRPVAAINAGEVTCGPTRPPGARAS